MYDKETNREFNPIYGMTLWERDTKTNTNKDIQ